MIITPYSGLSALSASGSVATNFPCCKLFLPCNDGSGNSLTDFVSGSSLATGVTLGWSTAYAATFPQADTGKISLGRTITVGAQSALAFTVVNYSTLNAAYLFGAADTDYFILTNLADNTGFLKATGITCKPTATPTTSAITGQGIRFVPGTSGEGMTFEDTLTTHSASAAANGSSDITTFPDITRIQVTNTVGTMPVYGLAFFVFANGLPGNLVAGLAWMTAAWQSGDKEIYPGWKGLA